MEAIEDITAKMFSVKLTLMGRMTCEDRESALIAEMRRTVKAYDEENN
jgi:hypothetical protein